MSLAKDKDVDIKDDPEAVVLTVVAVHNGAVPETVTPEEAETEETALQKVSTMDDSEFDWSDPDDGQVVDDDVDFE